MTIASQQLLRSETRLLKRRSRSSKHTRCNAFNTPWMRQQNGYRCEGVTEWETRRCWFYEGGASTVELTRSPVSVLLRVQEQLLRNNADKDAAFATTLQQTREAHAAALQQQSDTHKVRPDRTL